MNAAPLGRKAVGPLEILGAVTTVLIVGGGLWLGDGVRSIKALPGHQRPERPPVTRTFASEYPGIARRMRHRRDWTDFDRGWPS